MEEPQSAIDDVESERRQQHQGHDSVSPPGGENDHQNDLLHNDQQRQPSEGDMAAHDPLEYDFEVKEQDRWLPIANVARIMKGALPDNAKIAKEAKECMQECVSEFISFITSEASEKCHQEKRKTVNGEDILFAMTSLGFENYGEALKIYLARYRENLNARGDNTNRPAGAAGTNGSSSNNATTSPYNEASGNGTHTGLTGNALDQTADSTTDFAYPVGTTGSTDY